MKKNRNAKIGKKLVISFLIVAIIAGVIGVFSIFMLSDIGAQSKTMFLNYGNSQGYLGYVMADFQKERVYLREVDLNPDVENIKKVKASFDEVDKDMMAKLAAFGETCTTDEEKAQFEDLKAKVEGWRTFTGKLFEMNMAGDNKSASALKTEDSTKKIITDVTSGIENAMANNVGMADQMISHQESILRRDGFILIGIVAGAVAAALLFGILMSRNIGKPIQKMVEGANKLAEGDLNVQIDVKSNDEVGILAAAFGSVVGSVGKLIQDANMLADAAVEGNLSTRADAAQHKGDYKKIVEGVNNMLDAMTRPLNDASEQLALMAQGADLAEMNPDLYNGDFKQIINNLNLVRSSLYLMLTDVGMLAQSAVEVRLSVRADASRHSGGYSSIIEGVNNTLDAVITPVSEATAVLGEMAKGNLDVSMEGDYKGEFAVVKNAMNETIHSIKDYISEIDNVLGKIAGGNLNVEITSEFKGNFVQLKQSINTIVESLNGVLGEINTAANQVTAGAQQVSNGNQAISQGATEQASNLEELSATVTKIAEETRKNAENSKKSNEMALSAKAAAAQGNDHMKEMLKSMEDINESSENISKIIKVIDDIAFQTNILALNAAVEAARAGAHGKGFAVVAEEVRNLAARSAQAAKETAELIEGSIKNVDTGAKIANDTAQALSRIVESVDKTVELGEMIALASNDQATGIQQVNQGIEQMGQVVQTNSATSQEGAAASEELSGQAELLREKIAMFTLKKSTGRLPSSNKQIGASYAPAQGFDPVHTGDKY